MASTLNVMVRETTDPKRLLEGYVVSVSKSNLNEFAKALLLSPESGFGDRYKGICENSPDAIEKIRQGQAYSTK
jgi:hypothetical protein